jgi:hypothetical protein
MSQNMDDDELMEGEAPAAPPRAVPPGNVRITIQGSTGDPYVLETLASLLLGSAAEGSELLASRLKQWQANTDSRGREIYSESPDETDAERLRYAAVGVLARAPGVAGDVLTRAVRASDAAYVRLSNLFSPVTNSRMAQPLHRGYDQCAARGQAIVERWIDAGRMTEQRSRARARHAAVEGTDEAMDEVIGIMAGKPEVRDLVTQQTVGMAGELVGEVRERGAAADTYWERRIRRILRRG